ncbi:hypothetical protein N0V82_000023 [Gnomoniopsis sp. IMI 355080]|nr:hypothetical protein N0V82_000023 [Gnomoniopsis sp. IMI 355080]
MARISRRLKDKQSNQKSPAKYTSVIHLGSLDLDDYESSMGHYIHKRLERVFDDTDVNISLEVSFTAGNFARQDETLGIGFNVKDS